MINSTKVWGRARIELATPGSAVRLASVARHVTACAWRPGRLQLLQLVLSLKLVSEYDQEIPQSQTADNPVTQRGRAAQPSRDTRKTN